MLKNTIEGSMEGRRGRLRTMLLDWMTERNGYGKKGAEQRKVASMDIRTCTIKERTKGIEYTLALKT